MASKDYYSKEERQVYNREYKQYVPKRSMSSAPPPITPLKPMEYNPVYCSTFGCGKVLTSTESLCGSKCIDCQNKKRVDPTLVVKIK